jgi:hypothetical protein
MRNATPATTAILRFVFIFFLHEVRVRDGGLWRQATLDAGPASTCCVGSSWVLLAKLGPMGEG